MSPTAATRITSKTAGAHRYSGTRAAIATTSNTSDSTVATQNPRGISLTIAKGNSRGTIEIDVVVKAYVEAEKLATNRGRKILCDNRCTLL
jgi:hypothetical protein